MNKITQDVIDRLSEYSDDQLLTIYMPTHQAPTSSNISENQTRYKNLIRRGIELWARQESKVDSEFAEQRLEQHIDDVAFWQNTSRSLGIFVTPSSVEFYTLPIEVTEQIYVGDTFDILPLLKIRTMNQPYYLFALAMHEPKLFHGDMFGFEPVDITFPKSPEDALNIDEMFINSNTVRAGSGSMQGSPHGQGDSQQAGQEERLMYFRILDGILAKETLIDTSLPILVAATDSEASDYKTISKLPHILETHISGNRTNDTLDELHDIAYKIICERVIQDRLEKVVDRYQNSVGAGRATTDISSIQKAAEEGRISQLMLSPYSDSDDSIEDRSENRVLTLDIDDRQKQRLLSLIKKVIHNGGHIEIFYKYLMPSPVPVAALYRY